MFKPTRLLINTLNNLEEYLPKIEKHDKSGFGGIKNGKVLLENKTGCDIEKVIITIDILKSNGEIYNTQYVDFDNLKKGDTQVKAYKNTPKGSNVQVSYHYIKSNELTDGQEINFR